MTTKQKIYITMLELATKRDVDKITVKDVIEACKVSRQTFYYYYRDMEDLFETAAGEMNERVREKIQGGMPLEEWLDYFLEMLLDNKKLYLRILYSRYGAKALRGTQNAIRQWLMEYMKQELGHMREHLSAQELMLLLDFCAGGIFNLMRKLLQEDCADIDSIVQFTAKFMNGQIHL